MKEVMLSDDVCTYLGVEERFRFRLLNGQLFSTSDRHYLHRTLGCFNDSMVEFITGKKLTQKEVQAMISNRLAEPLVRLGLLEECVSTKDNGEPFLVTLKILNGEPVQVCVSQHGKGKVFDIGCVASETTLTQFTRRYIERFLTK